MAVVEPAGAAAFLERAGAYLSADEARHNLILGLAGTLRDNPALYRGQRLWIVEDAAGEVVGAALRTPPNNLVLARSSAAAIDELVSALEPDLPGVVGAVPEVDEFVRAWTSEHGGVAEPRLRQGIYAADAIVEPARPAPGDPRSATEADRPLLLDWWRAFEIEALGAAEIDEDANNRALDHRLGTPGNGIALWEDGGEPVSLVGFGSPTPTGVRVGPVYTPPERRGRGYASSLTAHVSAAQLAGRRSFCFLYTDLANPTSNKIYVDLGYRRVCDAVQYAFEPA